MAVVVVVPPPSEVKQQRKHNTCRFRGQAGPQLGAYRKNCTRRVVCSSGSPPLGVSNKGNKHMQVQRTGGLLKEKAVRCTVPGRFIPNPRTVAQNFPSALTSHQVWNSSHFPACWPCGLALGVLATRGWGSGSLSPCLPPCLAVGLVVVVPLQVLETSPWQCSPLSFWMVAPPRARWASC